MKPNPLTPEKTAEIERVVAKLRAEGRLPNGPQSKR